MAAHHEIHLESYVVRKLVENGWIKGSNSHYDPVWGLLSSLVWSTTS